MNRDLRLREALWDDIRTAMFDAGYGSDTARWFVTQCCSPMAAHEAPLPVKVKGDQGERWDEPYRVRLFDSMRRYLAMTEADRQLLHAGVEDGVKWRGEPIRQYIGICDATLAMREVGAAEYRQQAAAALRKLLPRGEHSR